MNTFDLAEQAFKEAVASANKEYDKTIAPAKKAYDRGLAPAETRRPTTRRRLRPKGPENRW